MTLLAIKYSVLLLFLLLTSCFYSEQGAENKIYLDVKYSSMIKMDVILSEDSTMLYSPSGLEFVRKGSKMKEVLRCNFANDSAKRYFKTKFILELEMLLPVKIFGSDCIHPVIWSMEILKL